VLFRQSYGRYTAGNDGLVAVGIRHGDIASVTSSLVGGQRLDATQPAISAEQAVLRAAVNDGLKSMSLAKLSLAPKDTTTFTNVAAKGLSGVQRTRLVALPTAHGARLAYETDINNLTANPLATISFVDALTGKVLVRHNAVDTLSNASGTVQAAAVSDQASATAAAKKKPNPLTFSGSFTPTACGAKLPLNVPAGSKSLDVVAVANNSANDISLNVFRGTTIIGTSDEATSPEAVAANLQPPATNSDTFFAQVCPSPNPAGPFIAPYDFEGVYTTSNQAASVDDVNAPYPPEWKYYPDSPQLGHDPDTRTKTCWTRKASSPSVTKSVKGCQQNAANRASRSPWDVLPSQGVPTFTTDGNNANEAQAWYGSTLTPGESYHPVNTSRNYLFSFKDQWFKSHCDPTVFTTANRNDIDASITNLFVGHNLFHDFAYRLGYTERNYNNQVDNFGATGPSQANDPEIGDVQSGAVTNAPITVISGATGEALPVEGRDNANQIPMQDGVAGITNQYLFQPIVGFYSPCHDGDLDMSVYGHEYTHEISNRMIAGPDTGLGGQQGGSMGESWSDLDALEFLNSMGYAGRHGEPKDSVGAYATGNNVTGIRDYRLGHNPLNYGDFGFDTTGPEVHADGEIWNGIQWQVRQALINQYKKKFPATNKRLERACALGHFPNGTRAPGLNGCPGDRHWIQYIYDSFLLEANGSPTMVDMKNMMLAAQKLRTHGKDRRSMAAAFAHGGLGKSSHAKDSEDTDPRAAFNSPIKRDNAHVKFAVRDAKTNKPVKATIYVGKYQARVTPYASTFHAKHHPGAHKTMVKGHYSFLVQAPGYGERRYSASFKPGKHYSETFRVDPNYASKHRGAKISGPGVRLTDLIDDDESTDAGYDGSATMTPIAGKAWTVALGGGKHRISSVRVSAQHRPADANDTSDFQNRFTDLRSFKIQVSSNGGKSYRTVKSSGKKFFPGRLPRPIAPNEILRGLSFKPVKADHVRLVIQTNQCTGFHGYRDADNDPLNDGDCRHTTDGFQVTAAELQVFRPDHKPASVQKVHNGRKHHHKH
jgi:hypothetical protein